ncbi:hypothetical protein [Larkinella soli]|uniref:hypothetical protein n=1 Tax=Larkinella soli TaxID=1770527 RepID=UPI000FFBE61D|nr:hypothetical protein [Larkinella soli]
MPGVTVSIPVDGKFVDKEWEARLKSFGRVSAGRGGVYKVPSANIPALSSNPINLSSKVDASRDKATVFLAADLGSGEFVKVGSREYNELESILKEFARKTQSGNELRMAEAEFNTAQKNHEKMVRQGEKLQRDIERNKKEKETLLRKIDENAKELVDLERALETNKTDVVNAGTEFENRKKAVEAVRAKAPK